jgi:hypothetical protein
MIQTDGVGASIILRREDRNPSYIGTEPRRLTAPTKYVDRLSEEERPDVNRITVVGIDPGKEDLLHCTDGTNFYRYTADQRRRQTKVKRNRYQYNAMKYYEQAGERFVHQWEAILSFFNSYTCDFKSFKQYIKMKIETMFQCHQFYSDPILRKFKWNSYNNHRRSESKMINKIRERFGGPENTIIAIGDWSSSNNHMRGKEPTKGKGFRKLFKQAGYKTYLVHEYNTSKICHKDDCHQEMTKFLHRPSKKPKYFGQNILVHGLLGCQSVNGCGRLWNRDVNGSLNIRMLALLAFQGIERPLAFR